jgi:membrane protein DedA with SNARE-associated domain
MAPPVGAPYQAAPATGGNTLSTLGMIFGLIGFLFFPIIIGVAGIILSAVAKSKGEKNANLALGVSIAGTVIGMIIGAAVGASTF